MRINLELKPCPGRTQVTTMVTLIEASRIWPDDLPPPLISSFDIDALTIAAQLHPEWPRGLLLDTWREDWQELANLTSASTIHLNEKLLSPARIEMLQRAQLPILAYTVNDPARAKELLRSGVTALFTDNPKELM